MSFECHECGFPIHSVSLTHCPKCDTPMRARTNGRLHFIDVAHAGESQDDAFEKLDRAIDFAIAGNFKGVKVVHGRGASRGRSVLKPLVVARMKREAKRHGGKVVQDKQNPGAHILYFE